MAVNPNAPHWTQEQAVTYEAALEAINDVIAGYSEHIDKARSVPSRHDHRLSWLHMRIAQARDVGDGLDPTDDASVAEVLREFSAMVRARDAAC